MTWPHQMESVRSVLGDRVRFIAIPDLYSRDPVRAVGIEYRKLLPLLRCDGVRIAKFWAAPRSRDLAEQSGAPLTAMALDSQHVQDSMRAAADLGMAIMVHVADPDTWFACKYADASRYGTKSEQYDALQTCLDQLAPTPFIAAHMGGSPEDLEFLSELLSQHSNLYLDTSAAQWMVRELSKHSRDDLSCFFRRWTGRILFGSDIVTTNKHLTSSENQGEAGKAFGETTAFDLYASRYWMLRTLLESSYSGSSPVADPDLAMIDPENYSKSDAPVLHGMNLSDDILRSIYHDAASKLLEPLYE